MATIVVAFDQRGLIGEHGKVPWDVPEERRHFAELTCKPGRDGWSVVVMGRMTWESLPAEHKPLRGRACVVLTHDQDYAIGTTYTADSLDEHQGAAYTCDELRTACERWPDCYIIGGEDVYEQAMSRREALGVDKIVASEMKFKFAERAHKFDYQRYFPVFRLKFHGWVEQSRKEHEQFDVVTYVHSSSLKGKS